jgi:hypothetical protein
MLLKKNVENPSNIPGVACALVQDERFEKCKIKRKIILTLGGFGWTLAGFRLRRQWKGVITFHY